MRIPTRGASALLHSTHLITLLLLCIALLVSAKQAAPIVKSTQVPNPFMTVQYFEDSDVVLFVDMAGIVHKSTDAGTSWDDIEDMGQGQAGRIYMNPFDNKVAVIAGRKNSHWVTRDQGESWTTFESKLDPFGPMPVSYHAGDSKKIILNTASFRNREAIYTTDGGKIFKTLREKTLQCMWAKSQSQFTTGDMDVDKTRILCIAQGKTSSQLNAQRLVISDNFFDTEFEPQLSIEQGRAQAGVVNMIGTSRYIVLARRADNSQELAMYSTQDSNTWHRALFMQQTIEADGYTVMESTNHSIRVDVVVTGSQRTAPMGILFSSNSNGTYFTANERLTNRNSFGFVDYERIEAIEGVALVNVVTNAPAALDGFEEKSLISQITFDEGRTFQNLKAGERDLHLHSFTEMKNQGRVFSSKAPGLVMGVGNTGEALGDPRQGNLFVSDDAGLTWREGLTGPHKFEFGDQGSILLAVYDNETKRVMYSLNHGKDWIPLEISETPFIPLILTTIPDSTSLKFILTGMSESKYMIYSIDFAGLDMRTCKKKDFETWFARDEENNARCIMGHTQSFVRRLADADCFIDKEGEEPQPDFESEHCACRIDDFECDYDFVRSEDKKECLPTENANFGQDKCKSGQKTFLGPSGWRLIPGNTCTRTGETSKDAEKEYSCEDAGRNRPGSGAANGKIQHTMTQFKTDAIRQYVYLERPDFDENSPETILMTTASERELWISQDHGKTWDSPIPGVQVVEIVPNSYSHEMVYFVTPGQKMYYSSNYAETIESFTVPSRPNNHNTNIPILQFHEVERDWLLFTGCAESEGRECVPEIFRSTKAGLSWEPMMSSVGNCEFVFREERDAAKKLVYCERDLKSDKRELVSSEDWFDTKDVVFPDILHFATMSEYIIVAAKDQDNRSALILDASIDAKTFAPANFPPKFNVGHQTAYTVLDSSTHSVFLHVTVNPIVEQEYGSIIKSNSNGTSYVMSLNGVNRNTGGFVDYEKALGIEGAAMVNVVANLKEVNEGNVKKLKTMITHNDGADWNYITPPDMNDDGTDYDCKDKPIEECSLQLHGYTERINSGQSYSSPSAIGLVMGNGNVGDSLKPRSQGDTFISRDGGISWKTAMQGNFVWEFGDQGSIIVLAEEEVTTNRVYYSLDEGDTWTEYEFGDVMMTIKDITTTPSDGSRNFLLWGTAGRLPTTVNLDFTGLTDTKCLLVADDPDSPDNDYYLWSPSHPMQVSNCLFGHVARYWRKKSERNCYNGPTLERLHGTPTNCSCTHVDFECDYNYERGKDNSCVLVGTPPDPAAVCATEGVTEFHPVTGYRRIPLDTCQGGQEDQILGMPQPCPGHEAEYKEKHGASRIGLFFAIVIPILVAVAVGYYVWSRFGSQFGRIQLGADGPRNGLDTSSAWLAWPVAAVSAIAAAVMAIPMLLGSVARGVRERTGGGSWMGRQGGSAPFTSRNSFSRGRGYQSVGNDESELLGEESDDEV